MKKQKQRRLAAPPNVAAKALSDHQFRLKVVKDKRQYSRKAKHKKGRLEHFQDVPFLFQLPTVTSQI